MIFSLFNESKKATGKRVFLINNHTVGRPELQAFYGALAGQKAKRGIFITSSGFAAHAVEFSRSVEGLVLIDGNRLVNLMMDNEVGVTSQQIKLPKIDMDYFEQ